MSRTALCYLHNYVALDYFYVKAKDKLPTGKHFLSMQFEPIGKPDIKNGKGVPAKVTLSVDGKVRTMFSGLILRCTIPIGGGGPEQVTPRYLGVIPRISPDGKLIAADDNGRVAIYPIEGGEPIKVFNNVPV